MTFRIRATALLLVTLVLLTLATLGSAGVSAGETYYRWLDSRGNPVLSDRPPPSGTEYEVVSSGSNLKRIVEPGEGAVPKEVKSRVGNEFQQVDTAAPAEAAEKNTEYCERAQENLKALESAPRIRIKDPENGELRYLSDEERELETAKAKEVIAVAC